MNKLKRPIADFTAVPNELLREATLSMKAKGLYCIMFSKPDGWVFYNECLVRESADGKDAVRAAMQELLAVGWVVRTGGGQGLGGIFQPYQYELLLNHSGKPAAVEPPRSNRGGEPASSNTERSKTENKERAHAQRLEVFLESLSEEIQIPPQWSKWAYDEFKWSIGRREIIFQTFRDYWKAQPGSKGIKADWEATWRNWCRREASFEKQTLLAKGEVRVRQTTAAEKAETATNAEYLKLLRQHPGKSEAEITEMMKRLRSLPRDEQV